MRAPGRDVGAAAVCRFSSVSSSPRTAVRRALSSATSKPSPRWPSRVPSTSKPVHSSSTERSDGSWSSTRKIPSPIACGSPAGTKMQSPGSTVRSLSASSMLARSWRSTQPARRSRSTSSWKPSHTVGRLPRVSTISHASVLPCARPRRLRANAWSGWKCTGSRSPASISFTSRAGSVPYCATCPGPRYATGSAAIASRSKRPSGSALRPSLSAPNIVAVDPTQSSGAWPSVQGMPRKLAIASPPR